MRLQAYNDNGTMKFRQVSGSQALDSLPVGTVLSYMGLIAPNGYLFCDGSTYHVADYPELYSKLGTNVLPDFRECVLVGAGQNSTDTIAVHDVYTVGEFKDDQIQNIGKMKAQTTSGYSLTAGGIAGYINSKSDLRTGTTTHGKQKGVNYIIKAKTIGIADIDINTIKDELTYSTEETMTGKTWIDGKPIYRKTYYSSTNWANNTVIDTIPNVSEVVNISSISRTNTKEVYQNYSDGSSRNDANFNVDTGELLVRRAVVFVNSYPAHVTIEYTKQ